MNRKRELTEKTVWRSDPHTQVKHLVYRNYLQCWMPKILQKFPQATIVDAFAGPGIYEDGPPGSPVVIAKTFLEHAAYLRFSTLNVVCLEERPDRVEELRRQVALIPASPKLRITIMEPGVFLEQQSSLATLAHGRDSRRPTLWLLDPFKPSTVPFSAVRQCAARPRDEVLLTLFTHEMHRFCEKPGFDSTLDNLFGGDAWRAAVAVKGAAGRKQAFAEAFGAALKSQGLLSGQFAVQVGMQTARYHLILATHNEAGLQCWNPIKWKLDGYTGAGASAATLNQPDLFGTSYTRKLEDALRGFAGSEQPMATLVSCTTKLGFIERQLREVLDDLAREGLAIRVHPITARSAWPSDGVVRFYAPEDVEELKDDPEA